MASAGINGRPWATMGDHGRPLACHRARMKYAYRERRHGPSSSAQSQGEDEFELENDLSRLITGETQFPWDEDGQQLAYLVPWGEDSEQPEEALSEGGTELDTGFTEKDDSGDAGLPPPLELPPPMRRKDDMGERIAALRQTPEQGLGLGLGLG